MLALTLVAFLLRTPYLDAQSLWRDEVDVIRLAAELWSRLTGDLLQARHNGPLFYLVMRGWLALAGESEFALRYVSLCGGILAVPLTYWVGRRLVGTRAGVMAAVLVTISAYLIWYGQDAKMYALVTALTLLALGCELEALTTGRLGWWAGFVLSASAALYIHVLSALMIPVYWVGLGLAWPHRRGARWPGLLALGLLTLPYVPLAVWQWPLVLNSYQTGHPFYPPGQMLSALFNLHARGVALVGGWVGVAGFVFAILGGLLSPLEPDRPGRRADHPPFRPGQVRARLWLLAWLSLPLLLVYLISLRAPVFEPRYLIFIAPAFYLLTGLGLVALSRLSWVAAGSAMAVIVSFSLLGVWVQATTPIKSDFRGAASFVMTHRREDTPIMFQMPYVRHTFDYYFEGTYAPLEGPWANAGQGEAQVTHLMDEALQGYPEVWLVSSESWLWDSRGLTQAWLEQNGHLLESAHFALVDVYHYALSGPTPATTGE